MIEISMMKDTFLRHFLPIGGRLRACFLGMIGSPHDADELFQETASLL